MSSLFGHVDHSLYSNGMTFLRRPMVQNINAIDADVVCESAETKTKPKSDFL